MGDSNKRTLSRRYESLDYDVIEDVIHLEHQHRSRLNRFIRRDLQRWLAIFLIGFATAMSGFFASFAVSTLVSAKFSHVLGSLNYVCPETRSNETSWEPLTNYQAMKCISLPYLIWLAWNIIPTTIGSLLVTYIAPIAAGSGIPVVKCYLNGVKIPEVVRFKTYVTKLLGVILSVVGGLAVGKEGPFIHCGAAIGAGLSQGKSTTFKFDTKLFRSFRNDRDKRDFVSAGASAGVAAAFGAPIGGVLFALEEGASFWNQALTWRIFFCSMMTSFILNLTMAAYNQSAGVLSFYSLVNFGLVEEVDYFWFEVPIYLCVAVFGGAIGASFCYINLKITQLRKRFIVKNYMKVIEVILVAILCASVGTCLILFASECRDLPTDSQKEAQGALKGHVMTFMCPPGQYSAMSSLWLKTSEGASSTFMVLQDDIWSIKTLGLFLIAYYILAVITYGISISAGVFIPSLLIGATGGRMVGLMLRYYLGPRQWLVQLNKFAIIGAASTLGGVVRMTISLTVIIIEATGCISFGLPIMICLMVSKWVADSFIEGLYDLSIHQAGVPFLDWEPLRKSYSIYASDVMSPKVIALQSTETVANLIEILKSTSHNGFPVVDLDDDDDYSTLSEQNQDPGEPIGPGKDSPSDSQYLTPNASGDRSRAHGLLNNLFTHQSSSSSDRQILVTRSSPPDRPGNDDGDDTLTGSFQRCSVTAKRKSYGRFRGLVLRWQLLVMLHSKIFNENERSYELMNLDTFQDPYPRYPSIEDVIQGLTPVMHRFHVDLRAILNPTCYTVNCSASFSRIYRLFRSLGLRHLVVTDDRNHVVGMITRKDLARYIRRRDSNGESHFHELRYSS